MMNMKKSTFAILLVVIFLLGSTTALGGTLLVENGILGKTVKVSKEKYTYYKELDSRYAKLNELYDEVVGNYYTDVDESKLATGMYKGLVAGLEDPYSSYMTKEEYTSWTDNTMGEFEGVGITFSTNNDGEYEVINTIPNTPAEKAGVKAGDIILGVDGKTYETMDKLSVALKGAAGTKVSMTYERDGKRKTVSMKRATIVNETVTSKMLSGNIGYIAISSFEEHTAETFAEKLKQMEAKKVTGLVIDLRENGGGLVQIGAEIADSLLGEGTITYLQDQKGKKQYIKSDAKATDLPYTVLVDGGTASTSEIIAAAIKDDGKHSLIGTKTFGKGIVQSTGKLSEGDALKLTIMQYFSPKGNVINKKGVTPDYVVKNGKNSKVDKQLNKAVELLKEK